MIVRPLWRKPFALQIQKNIRPLTTVRAQPSADFILTEERGNKGILILNRPKAKNALSTEMLHTIFDTIDKWQKTKSMILIKSSVENAFSAGGDLTSVVKAVPPENGRFLFRIAYTAHFMISNLQIPQISITDGLTIGGGASMAIFGKYRIATEKTVYTMPEAAIGLVPDSGTSYLFPRLQGNLGRYVGLTGCRLKAVDVLHAGIATHYCGSSKIADLEHALLSLENTNDIENVLNDFCPKPATEFTLSKHLGQINKHFAASSVEEIVNSLKQDNSEWAKQTIKTMLKSSPTSLKVTLHAQNLGANLSLGETLQMEYRLATRLIQSCDFREGVAALLIRKDNSPKWNPARIEDVTDEYVRSFFQPLPNNEELPIDVKLNLDL